MISLFYTRHRNFMNINIIGNEYEPETLMMLQAFYSRNHKPIQDRLDSMGSDSASVKKSLEKWFIQYNHKSIGQNAGFTIFIEDVSILAAKAIQDSKLYSGIETSTRYIDFSNKDMISPIGHKDIQQDWLNFYTKYHDDVLAHVAYKYELDIDNPIEYKTAKARSFDILRGFIPAGCKTQLSWFTTFANANERLVQLLYHPLEEVRQIAYAIIADCKSKYPYAFSGIDKDIKRYKEYYIENSYVLNYFNPDSYWTAKYKEISRQEIPVIRVDTYPDASHMFLDPDVKLSGFVEIAERPKGLLLPRYTNNRPHTFGFEYILDYGSFRDIQRHRNCDQPLPILTTTYGFNSWYIDSLPEYLQEEAISLIYSQTCRINDISEENSDKQYLVPLGFNVNCILNCSLQQLVYIAELRTSKTVHPTLRVIAKEFARVAEKYVPIFDDKSDDEIDTRRGSQDIIEL